MAFIRRMFRPSAVNSGDKIYRLIKTEGNGWFDLDRTSLVVLFLPFFSLCRIQRSQQLILFLFSRSLPSGLRNLTYDVRYFVFLFLKLYVSFNWFSFRYLVTLFFSWMFLIFEHALCCVYSLGVWKLKASLKNMPTQWLLSLGRL